MRKFLTGLLTLMWFFTLKANHIVGGFLSYKYISGSTYEVTLRVFRDCSNTNNIVPFDGEGGFWPNPPPPFAYVHIFNMSGNEVGCLSMSNPDVSDINPPYNNPCLQITSNVCVQEGLYVTQVALPSSTQGYMLAYERCCRNASIANISNPSNTGTVDWAYVPPTNTFHNNSPVFNNFPPIFICVNSNLVFDHSASDPDGDVLRYSLCTPFSALGPNNPTAECGNGTYPFQNVSWVGSYNSDDPMGGGLQIDSITGVLTGRPSTLGQYVVGVCVSEYRGGQLIGTYLRDFQFNVTQCNIPSPSIPSASINPSTGIGIYELQCQNYTVTFQNNTYNPPPTDVAVSYEWDFGVPGITTDVSTQQYPTYTYPDTGVYLVRLIAVKGDSTSPCADTAFAYVKIYPKMTAGFEASNICERATQVFTDTSTSTYGSINHWSWNFGDGTTSSQQSPSHAFANGGNYTVRLIAQNDLGCIDTAYIPITIYDSPVPSFTTGPTCVGSQVNFTNTTTDPVASQLWTLNIGVTDTSFNPHYTYNAVSNYGVKLVEVGPNGCIDSVTQVVVVHPLPTVTVIHDTLICPYTSAQLYAGGAVDYYWSPATGLSDSTIMNPTATPAPPSPFTYTVHGIDQYQCVNTNTVTISFYPIAPIDAGIDTSVCLNPNSFHDSTQLHATGGVSYVWSPATGLSATNIPNPWARPTQNTEYYVTGTDVNGCKLTDSVGVYVLDPALNLILQDSVTGCRYDTLHATIVNQGASAYLWNPLQYLTNQFSYNTGFYPPATTNYILTVSNYCYTKSDTVQIIIHQLPALGLKALDSVCLGNSIQLNAQNAATYQWNPDPTLSADNIGNPTATPTANTKYIVTGTSIYGCVNKDSTVVLVYVPSIIYLSPDVRYICQGASIQLHVTGANTYVWSPASSLNNATSANPIATPSDTTYYVVVATNIHGCHTTDSLPINVQKPIEATVTTPVEACAGTPVQLHASGGLFYRWVPASGLNNPSTNDPFATPDSTTLYTVRVSNNCFTDSAHVDVIIHQLPFVDAGPDTTIWRDTYGELHGTVAATTYFWNQSQYIQDATSLVTIVNPPQTSIFELFAYDNFGCLNRDTVIVTVEPHTVMNIPTGFSPNGDGMNDVFHIVSYLNIEHLKEFAVFDRWGEKVFSTDNINDGWDGNLHGRPMPIGVYVWMVVAESKDGKEVVKRGNITLIR